jgi:hypothetical protein
MCTYFIVSYYYCVDALFLTNVYKGFKLCPSLLESVGFPTRNFRDFLLFAAAFSNKSCTSARCASAANTLYRGTDRPTFGNQLVALKSYPKVFNI